MELTRVKFLRSRRRNKRGDLVSLFPGVANVLIKRGIVVAVGEIETAMIEPQEQAVRRRGRPRKVIQ